MKNTKATTLSIPPAGSMEHETLGLGLLRLQSVQYNTEIRAAKRHCILVVAMRADAQPSLEVVDIIVQKDRVKLSKAHCFTRHPTTLKTRDHQLYKSRTPGYLSHKYSVTRGMLNLHSNITHADKLKVLHPSPCDDTSWGQERTRSPLRSRLSNAQTTSLQICHHDHLVVIISDIPHTTLTLPILRFLKPETNR